MNLENKENMRKINIDGLIYDKIYHLRFISYNEEGYYKCYVAL